MLSIAIAVAYERKGTCVETTIEHLALLLYSKFVYDTFTIIDFRTIKGRDNSMMLRASYAVL
eukprot:9652-Amphidinium_carterae.1